MSGNEVNMKAEFEKYITNINSELEEQKAERSKLNERPPQHTMRHKLELYLTAGQLKLISEFLMTLKDDDHEGH